MLTLHVKGQALRSHPNQVKTTQVKQDFEEEKSQPFLILIQAASKAPPNKPSAENDSRGQSKQARSKNNERRTAHFDAAMLESCKVSRKKLSRIVGVHFASGPPNRDRFQVTTGPSLTPCENFTRPSSVFIKTTSGFLLRPRNFCVTRILPRQEVTSILRHVTFFDSQGTQRQQTTILTHFKNRVAQLPVSTKRKSCF